MFLWRDFFAVFEAGEPCSVDVILAVMADKLIVH